MKYAVRINLRTEVEAADPTEAIRNATIYCLSTCNDDVPIVGLTCSAERLRPALEPKAIAEAPYADEVTTLTQFATPHIVRPTVSGVPDATADDGIPF